MPPEEEAGHGNIMRRKGEVAEGRRGLCLDTAGVFTELERLLSPDVGLQENKKARQGDSQCDAG
jgi:hypothetical protein